MVSDAAAGVFRKPHDNGKAPVALDDRADFLARQRRGNGAVQILGLKIVAAKRVAVGFDFQQGRASEGVELHVAAAGDLSKQVANLGGQPFQFLEVVAVNLHRDVGADAGHHFVEAHLNRLREEIGLARHMDGEFAPHQFDQFVPWSRAARRSCAIGWRGLNST